MLLGRLTQAMPAAKLGARDLGDVVLHNVLKFLYAFAQVRGDKQMCEGMQTQNDTCIELF